MQKLRPVGNARGNGGPERSHSTVCAASKVIVWGRSRMPKFDDIPPGGAEVVSVKSIPWLSQTAEPGLVRGGCYLFTGPPGIGKSTLANQLAGGLAKQGVKVLYISTEQGLGDLKRCVERIHGSRNGRLPQALRDNYCL